MPKPKNILAGEVYGKWTVTKSSWRSAGGSFVVEVVCLCDPARRVVRYASSLRSGDSRSCGCARVATSSAANLQHGQARKLTRAYRSWKAMRSRCLRPNNPVYKNYGGRGITIDPRWSSFEDFFADMGESPSAQHSLGRIDNDGPYAKANCAWQTVDAQCNNTRSTRRITFEGRTASLTQWAREYGLRPHTLRARLEANWDTARALETPLRTQQAH